MASKRPSVDVVLVGMGWSATILARELTRSGLSVVGLERGRDRQTVPDFQAPAMHDELKYSLHYALMQDLSRETVTLRNNPSEEALPYRRFGSFLPGTDLGGAGVHWSGACYRYVETDFRKRSHYTEKYGAKIFADDITVQDWPLSYDDLEPYYDRFEYLCGIGGVAGNLNGTIQPGGNPFESPRKRPFPNPPMKMGHGPAIFAKAASSLGYKPFPQPSANVTRAYTNPEGLTLNPCVYCGFCSNYGCEHFAKSSPHSTLLPVVMKSPKFELRFNANVIRINLDAGGQRATGVTYVDASGNEVEQPAEIVILCGWVLTNARLMLLSKIGQPYDPATGQGTVGRNFTYQTSSAVDCFFDEKTLINPFMGAGAMAMTIDEFNGDNFDHGPLGFIGGAYIQTQVVGGAPIKFHPVPRGTAKWGLEWKRAVARHYNHTMTINASGSNVAWRNNSLSLDPTYRDANGLPLLRMTFDFHDNDIALSAFVTAKMEEIARATGAKIIEANPRTKPYSSVPYQSTHLSGGLAISATPRDGVVNRYCQSWDVPNLFIQGASLFPQNVGYNPTVTVGALAYWTAKAITEQYVKTPAPLVQA